MWTGNLNAVVEQKSRASIAFGSALSLAVAPLLVVLLSLRDELQELGHYSSAHVPLALLLAESLKFVFAAARPEVPYLKDAKLPKIRKATKFRLRDFFKCLIFLPTCVGAYFVALVLFGAPIINQYEETFMLSLLLTILTIFPSCFHAGVDPTMSILTGSRKFSGDKTMETLQQHIFLTLFGTWCGAIAIPLDWDRPWQAWPVPCCLGALAGYTFSHMLTLIKLLPFLAMRIARKTKY
ncbi:phosphatidylinositol glycan anchor biosynthesis class F [Arctopsyche grandis]|uniref:phosphatidylinositol glycan anchor biosynthesis class F n=1 Tax=Arctopsyche grandis TaxID=121162 RepID=UPI00406D6E0C